MYDYCTTCTFIIHKLFFLKNLELLAHTWKSQVANRLLVLIYIIMRTSCAAENACTLFQAKLTYGMHAWLVGLDYFVHMCILQTIKERYGASSFHALFMRMYVRRGIFRVHTAHKERSTCLPHLLTSGKIYIIYIDGFHVYVRPSVIRTHINSYGACWEIQSINTSQSVSRDMKNKIKN